MTLHASDFLLTRGHTPKLEIVEYTDSTNADVLGGISSGQEWPHLSVLVSDDQRAGRGRLDRSWETPAGSALAISVVIDATKVPDAARSWLPLIAGLAMTQSIAAQIPRGVAAKWPNDVLVGDRKICGILAEVASGGARVVIGAGVNTAMTAEQAPVDTATSFAMQAVAVHLDLLVSHYLGALSSEIDALVASGGDAVASGLHDRYVARCSTLGKQVRVHLPGGEELVGEAVGIAADGRLMVDSRGEQRAVAAGDVVHVRPAEPTGPSPIAQAE